jgi:hypothetical protein
MKKIIASLIVFGFAVAMVACGGKKEEAATTADTTVVEAPASEAPAATDTTATDTTAAQ